MSTYRFDNVTFNSTFAAVFCAVVVLAGPVRAAGATDACAEAAPLTLGSSLRTHGGNAGEITYFELEVPEPGIVALDVSSPGPAGAEARLGYAGHLCDTANENQPFWIERAARRLTFAARQPGRFFFRVAGQDPLRPPGELKVSAGFVATADLRRDVEKEEDDEVFEIEPDGKAADADKEEDDEVFEIEPDGKAASGLTSEHLCGLTLADDHGDTPGCATLMAGRRGELSGEIGNAWGDDQDVFALLVTSLQTIEISATGETDTQGSLYDVRGHRLAADDDGGAGTGFRIVETLSPGLYFLEVEGSGAAEGQYRVHIDTVPW